MFQLAGIVIFGTLLLSGCQSTNTQTTQNVATPTNQTTTSTPQTEIIQPKPLLVPDISKQQSQNLLQYKDLASYGESMGCRAALQEEGTPKSDWQQAPKVPGTYQEYIQSWKQGFKKCRIGLGPVQLPVD